jgi:hypothetical protein
MLAETVIVNMLVELLPLPMIPIFLSLRFVH